MSEYKKTHELLNEYCRNGCKYSAESSMKVHGFGVSSGAFCVKTFEGLIKSIAPTPIRS